MLFRYTENPPENRFFCPRVPAAWRLAFSYTENSSFRYTRSGRDPSGPEIRKDLDTDTLYRYYSIWQELPPVTSCRAKANSEPRPARGFFAAASTDDVNLASRRPALLYGNPWFSVQAVACTEIISFPYTPNVVVLTCSDLARYQCAELRCAPATTWGLATTPDSLINSGPLRSGWLR